MLNEPVATERLRLEPRTLAHAEVLFGPLQDERIYRWISTVPPESLEWLKEKWTRTEARLSPTGEDAWLNWAVRRVSDGAYVGLVDAVVNVADVATNVGYMLFPPFWGRGYASEAVIGVAEHLEHRGVTRMWATVTAGNVASTRVLERAGFARTRILPLNDTIRGVQHDDIEHVRGAASATGRSRSP